MKYLNLLIGAVVLIFVTACGGGGGDGGPAVSVKTDFSGKIIDGYIKNAKVCLDLNSNLKCDDGPGEEEAAYTVFSGVNGSYSFSYTGTRNVAALHIIAEASANSIDEDDKGKTFAEAGRNPVSLLTPASAPQAVSPLTTLVSNQQIISSAEGKTLTVEEAESRVKVAANLPSSLMLVGNDYKSLTQGNADTAVIAKAVTLAMADTQTTIKNNTDFSKAATSSGKVASTEAVKEASKSVIADLAKNIGADGKLKVTAAEFQTASAQTISGNIQEIVKVVAAPINRVWDPSTYLKKGMYFLNIKDGEWFGDGNTPEQAVRISGPLPSVSGVKQSGDGAKFYDGKKMAIKTVGGTYVPVYKWPQDYFLVEAGWVRGTDENVFAVTRNENCFTMNNGYASQEVCGKSTSWAGKTVSEAGFCTTATKKTFFKSCINPDLKFPDDAISNDFGVTSLSDEYRVWGVDNGPDIIYSYKQVGSVITIKAPNHGFGQNMDLMLDFKSGASMDGAYAVASVIDANTFTVNATSAINTEGTVVRYWGGWLNAVPSNKKEVTLENFILNQMDYKGSYIWFASCSVAGQFIVDSTAPAGYSVSWARGKQAENGNCSVDTSTDAKKYIQTTKLSIDTVKGQKVLVTVAPDIYKVSQDTFTGIYLIWSVVKNSAGVIGVYNGELQKSSVKQEIISGNRQAIGNRSFVETINKAWGYADLPPESTIFSLP